MSSFLKRKDSMKKLITSLQNGNLTPKDRVLLLVHSYIEEDKTGKGILTKADRHAISDGWRPKENSEAREYNRFNDGWRLAGFAILDAQTIYLHAVISYTQISRLVDFIEWSNYKKNSEYFKRLHGLGLKIDDNNALNILLQNSGLEFEQVIYRYAFESLSDDIKKDILTLYPDAETERQYLDQEESIASIFNNKKKLDIEDKEKITNLIIESLRNKYHTVFKENGLASEEWNLYQYYADLPILEVVKKWADNNKIYIGNETNDSNEILIEKIKKYAEENVIDICELLKNTILTWLDDGLFTEDYIPLYNSKNKETCNGADTKLPHDEIFIKWLNAKAEAIIMIQELIDLGKLKVENKTRDIFKFKETRKIITGESLYYLENDKKFVVDYKKQVDDFKLISNVSIYINQHRLLKEYAILLGYEEIFKRLSKTYEIDLTYKISEKTNALKQIIKLLNNDFYRMVDKIEPIIYKEHDITFSIETFLNDLMVDVEKIEPQMGGIVESYLTDLKKTLEGDF